MALTVFTDQDRELVANAIKALKENEAITAFKQLSGVIKESTDLLPPKTAPSLARLANAYSVIDVAITNGLTRADDILTEFVVKSCEVLQCGMSDADQASLNKTGSLLSYDFVRQLPVFNDECREELIDIYKDILEQTGGDRLQNLIEMRKPLEVRVVESSKRLENLAKQLATAQGRVDALNYDIEMSERAIQINSVMEAVVGEDRAASVRDFFREGFKIFDRIKKTIQVDTPAPIKDLVSEELVKLKRQILAQQRAVQERRNTECDDQGTFWLFSWKVREVHVDDEERLACEKLWSLLEQTAILSDRLNNLDSWSTDEFNKLMTSVKEELPNGREALGEARKVFEDARMKHEELEGEFHAVVAEIEEIYKNSGSRDDRSIEAIDRLARAILRGSNALTAAFGLIRTSLEAIDTYADLLVSSVLDALNVLNIGDQYTGKTGITTVRTALTW